MSAYWNSCIILSGKYEDLIAAVQQQNSDLINVPFTVMIISLGPESVMRTIHV